MEDLIELLKTKAVENKQGIKKEGLTVTIGDDEQKFRISGIGEKAVKIEKYVKYDEIIEVTEGGNDNGLEAAIKEVIEEYEPEIPEESEE
ncbi:hypothetical protein [Methanobrevibacter filiformis]|uniref:Uncharacterized protein n=1 Tax=Methanobrevibacter filiformis TaxID=55758 RepID=A0A166BKK3_9EURY|nr:hypothetical protein [Methanobrevibacter filiformis]KZX13489.1 hypothetical protein MBFIL_10110 [Methanobrevibacter filiformis]